MRKSLKQTMVLWPHGLHNFWYCCHLTHIYILAWRECSPGEHCCYPLLEIYELKWMQSRLGHCWCWVYSSEPCQEVCIFICMQSSFDGHCYLDVGVLSPLIPPWHHLPSEYIIFSFWPPCHLWICRHGSKSASFKAKRYDHFAIFCV